MRQETREQTSLVNQKSYLRYYSPQPYHSKKSPV